METIASGEATASLATSGGTAASSAMSGGVAAASAASVKVAERTVAGQFFLLHLLELVTGGLGFPLTEGGMEGQSM